eukprot:2918980-Rhodomonas_salina.3
MSCYAPPKRYRATRLLRGTDVGYGAARSCAPRRRGRGGTWRERRREGRRGCGRRSGRGRRRG